MKSPSTFRKAGPSSLRWSPILTTGATLLRTLCLLYGGGGQCRERQRFAQIRRMLPGKPIMHARLCAVYTAISPSCRCCRLLSPKFDGHISELNTLMKHWVLLGNTADSAPALPLILSSSRNNGVQGCLSLQPADKSLIEFLNAKGLGCKISQHSQRVQRRQKMAFQENSRLNMSFYANGYELTKE